MKRSFLAAAGAAFVAIAPAWGQDALAIVTPQVFGALPTVDEAAISPDGKTLATLRMVGGRQAVVFRDLSGVAKPVGMDFKGAKVRSLRWASPDHVMALISDNQTVSYGKGLETYEIWRWVIIDRTAGKSAIPFRTYEQGSYWTSAGRHASPTIGNAEQTIFSFGIPSSLYRVALSSGADELIQRGDGNTIDWVLDAAGEPKIRVDYSQSEEERRLFVRSEDGKFTKGAVFKEKLEDDAAFDAIALEGSLVWGLLDESGYRGLRLIDPATGVSAGRSYSAPNHDISSVVIDPHTGKAAGFVFVDDYPSVSFFDGPLSAAQGKVERALPSGAPMITSWSADYSKFIVRVSYADHPDQFFLYEPAAKSLAMIEASIPSLDGKSVAKRSRFDYFAKDGLSIRGYLTAATSVPPKNAPLVVLPHGGPSARDNMAFDWWAAFYAARGYLVYQPNFRGSDGYGRDFEKAGWLEWGAKMQDDVDDGVRKLIEAGTADPNRICIVGASYGGYAALVGATRQPSLYRCAVSVNGVSNVPSLIAYQSDRGSVAENAWDVRIGGRVKDNESLRAISPYYMAKQSTASIMLIHGDKDTVVPIDHSYMMRRALEEAGKSAEFVVLKGEDHWLSTSTARTEMLARSIAFIDSHIGR